jgi:hypothetical protein
MLNIWTDRLRMRAWTGLATCAVMAGTASGAALFAAPKPMVLSANYDDSIATELKLPKDSKTCRVRVAQLADERRSPEMIGVYFGRAIHAPDDRDAWLRSIIAALKSRKIAVEFAAASPDPATGSAVEIVADIAVTKAWIANTESNMSTSIVLRVKTMDASGAPVEHSYRGGASHMSYWSGGPGELQRAFDTSVARALDAMAADLHQNCASNS